MNDYIIMTDSGCDISPATLSEWGVKCVDLSLRNVKTNVIYRNRDVSVPDFYRQMRNGTVFQTSGVNPAECTDAFEVEFRCGKDIVYIALSSGISVSKKAAELGALDATDDFPHNRVYVVDSLCACGGQGLLVYLAVKKKNEGADFDTVVAYLNETASKICHWFTVDDLKYLKRGGRISAASAFAATVLDIKPVMHVDDSGRLVAVSKVRGRKQAVRALVEKYQALAEEPGDGVYFICHGDCLEDALLLENLIIQEGGKNSALITDIGPVIGAHSGPGTLALFFEGKQR